MTSFPRCRSGFTLIELIVVIAIVGVLASMVVTALNPIDQIAKSRDANRISAITQIGKALVNYKTSTNGNYPSQGSSWMDTLISFSELPVKPDNPDYIQGLPCNDEATLGDSGFCYKTGSSETIVYAQLESRTFNEKCSSPETRAYWAFSAANARACLVCAPPDSDPDNSAPVTCID